MVTVAVSAIVCIAVLEHRPDNFHICLLRRSNQADPCGCWILGSLMSHVPVPSCKVQLLQRWIGQKLIIKRVRWEPESVLCDDRKPRFMAQTLTPSPSFAIFRPVFPAGTPAGNTLSLAALARANSQRWGSWNNPHLKALEKELKMVSQLSLSI